MKGSRGKATGALCVCRLPNAGPRACPLGNSPSLSGPVPSRTPHNFLLLGCPAQWVINPSCLPWFSFTQGKVTHPCFAGGGGAGPSPEAPFRQQQQTPRCPHPHTPASASVPLRTSFGAQRTLPTCRGGERAREGMPSREQLPAVIDGTRSLANPKSLGWDHSKAGILDWFPIFPVGLHTSYLFCSWFSSWSRGTTVRSVFTGITSQMSYLYLNPRLGLCFWQNATGTHPRKLPPSTQTAGLPTAWLREGTACLEVQEHCLSV